MEILGIRVEEALKRGYIACREFDAVPSRGDKDDRSRCRVRHETAPTGLARLTRIVEGQVGTVRAAVLRKRLTRARRACVLAVVLFVAGIANAQSPPSPRNAGPIVATPTSIVDEILELAGVGRDDFVVDLGSGDGRIVIAAVARYGARGGFGVDISPEMVALSNRNAVTAGVGDRVHFYERDLFATDVREATVVTVYLLPSVMGEVERKLRAELKPGTRVVVHDFPFPQWQAERAVSVESLDKIKVTGFTSSQIFLYRVPERP